MKTDLEIAREILDLAEGKWNAANMAMQSSGDPEWRMEQKVKELRRVFTEAVPRRVVSALDLLAEEAAA